VPAVPGYFKAIREVRDRHGVLLIVDEVMSGMDRTGTLHASEQEGIARDLMAIAKGLGGGFFRTHRGHAGLAGTAIHRHGA
jgi:adenosylmethionine-8-amino-7-oxononanoate aminotransferase